MTTFSMMNCLPFVAAVFLGWLQQSNAELPAVGNCSFMEYYCTVREYETRFFKSLYKDPTEDCGLQFWILYYRVLKKAESCLTNSRSLHAANIKEIQSLYCSGLDLEKPLMLSLSPCSNKHKQEVDGCINDFATTFSSNYSHSSLCRQRGKAKMCTILAWRTFCNYSDVAEGVLKKVIGSFNPFCDEDKDPWAEETDLCANYTRPPCRNQDGDGCPGPTEQSEEETSSKNTAGMRDGVLPYLFYLVLFVVLNLYLTI